MKTIIKLFKTLFVLTIIVNCINVFGTNLIYKSTTDTVEGMAPSTQVKITNVTEASPDSIDAYAGHTGWIILPPGTPPSVTGGDGGFESSYYIFAPKNQYFTAYGTGFQNVSTTDYDNVYYDTNSVDINLFTDNFSYLSSNPCNIQENQDVNTDGFYRVSKSDTSKVQWVAWKVVGTVRVDVYQLSDSVISDLKTKFGEAALNDGIRFSSILTTQTSFWAVGYPDYKSYMDTAWKFYGGTSGTGWSICERGFQYSLDNSTLDANYTGTYKPGASAANEFDNILKIPTPILTTKRDIYINHVDESGNVIPGLQNSNIKLVSPPGPDKVSDGPKNGYQEHYTISGNDKVEIRKSDQATGSDGIVYTFEKGVSSTGSTLSLAAADPIKYIWVSSPATFGINTNNVDDVLVVNLVYSKPIILPPTQKLPPFEIVGKLCFINTNSPYASSTSGNAIDYIPSTKTLTPYAEGAYPYTVRALRYDTKYDDLSSSATITVKVSWSWNEYTQVCPGCTGDKCTPPPCYCSSSSYSDSASKSFTYTVPYRHTYYDITNFKMYRISKLEVYDEITNIGGILFGGGTYTIQPSSSYNAKFTGTNSGKTDDKLTVKFDSITYDFGNKSGSSPSGDPCPGSGEPDALKQVADTYGKVTTAKIAADDKDLRIYYKYDNDFITVDGMETMLQRNYKEWDEHINLETNTKRDLDSTKAGPGSTNGAVINYTSNLMNFMRPPSGYRTTNADFTPNYQTVPLLRENGIRWLKGKIYYDVLTTSGFNVGADSFSATDATYTTYPTYSLANAINVSSADFVAETKDYKGSDVNKVNVMTPMRFGSFELDTAKIVDHTASGSGTSTVLQKNAEFTITPDITTSNEGGYSNVATREFIKGFYFIFDFDVLIDNNNDGTYESFLPAYTSTYRAGNATTLRGKTTESFGSTAASQLRNTVKIVAISTNITALLQTKMNNSTYSDNVFKDNIGNIVRTNSSQNQLNFLTRTDIVSDAYHAIYKIITTKNIGRIFDFAVTDCTDLAFENVFRKPNGLNVNETTSVAYYSGYKKWNLYNPLAYNDMVDRPDTEIGTTPKTILPLGPYKNTNMKYVNAPKMGYRISYDLKTTGYIANQNRTNTRTIDITPSYYYISKDGKIFDKDITLYYKNSTNNYIKFVNPSPTDGYTIYFKPNDGYRYLRNGLITDNIDMMSKKLEPLKVSSTIKLNSSMMSINNTSFIQSWYGEFKLPNSTIAISNIGGNIHNNINNPYKDGYIGVRFDIRSTDSGGQTIIYGTNDKSAGTPNTSQWDYEGFMNFKTPGSLVTAIDPIRYQLDKDIWIIDNTRYQDIKGTVVLFDLDNRAANDFE